MKPTTVLVFGGAGMLGHVLFRRLSQDAALKVFATVRSPEGVAGRSPDDIRARILTGIDANNPNDIEGALAAARPDVVINCIGLIKQLPIAKAPLSSIAVNALFPHRLALSCRAAKARMIHVSTDCVFDGKRGGYRESDLTNAEDLYGRTKALGEVGDAGCLTLRTSIIGHELKSRIGLVEWFLSQEGSVRGFTKAVFSGFPTIEFARIVSEFVLPNRDLSGILNVSSAPISKFDLLHLIARKYGKQIEIEPDESLIIDRSLDSTLFRSRTGYEPPSWERLIDSMHADFLAHTERSHGAA